MARASGGERPRELKLAPRNGQLPDYQIAKLPNPEAVLLIAADRGVERVACACEIAHDAGVHVGMTVAHARSLLAGRPVRIAPHKPEDVERALDRLVQWAFRFSPVVAADYPDGLLLDITGCAHLYAGEEKLAKSIVASLEQWRLPARAGVAPTAAAARAVARYTQERITVIPDHAAGDELRFLPVSALGIAPHSRDALAEIGVVSVDQLLNLPREDLASRFGTELTAQIDMALGLSHELIQTVRQIEPVEFKRTFEGAVRNQEAIFLTVEQLLREMVGKLARDESGVNRLGIKLFRIDERASLLGKEGQVGVDPNPKRKRQLEPPLAGARGSDSFKHPSEINLSLSFPSRNFAHLWSLLRPKLERVHLGYGVEEIALRVLHAQRLAHTQMELWPDAATPENIDDGAIMGQWLDQVIERLGRHAVVEMSPAERYLPEEAFAPQVLQKADGLPTPRQGEGKGVGKKRKSKRETQTPHKITYPATRPSKLFSPPEHAWVIALVPDGPPAWISWRNQESNVLCGYGPERICAPWWGQEIQSSKFKVQKRDEPHSMRDYFVIQTEGGIWLWMFRDGRAGEWYVHGEWS